ncbi:MAG: thioesterase family protein [Candidatus Zixiibacteriota bacterium]
MPYTYHTTIKLYDTDAAGIVFFGNYFRLAHDVYQTFLEEHGIRFADVLGEGRLLLPIVHAEADYTKPLVVGDKVAITLNCAGISTHSFVLDYEMMRDGSLSAGKVSTVHVLIDRASNTKTPLPDKLRRALETILESE